MSKIDVSFDFTSDTPGFWDGFWERRGGLGLGGADPDSESPTLHEYHRLLWSRKLPNGQTMNLKKGTGYYYLTWEDFRFASDTIITDMRYVKNKNIIRAKEGLPKEYDDYMMFLKKEYEFLEKRNKRIDEYCKKNSL